MVWATVGALVAVLLAWSAWDAGRPGRASGAALLVMRTVGGVGLLVMAAHALDAGAGTAATLAGAGALPLILGLVRLRSTAGERRLEAIRAARAARAAREPVVESPALTDRRAA